MPAWVWVMVIVLCVYGLVWLDVRRINRRGANYSAIEAERLAAEASRPMGNVSRWVE